MAARLHNNTTVPAGGFRYWVAETETWIRGATYPDWRDKTVKHCKSNELDPPSEEAMIDQLCEQLDGNWC